MKTKILDRNIQGKCKLCDTEFVHEWSSHFFNTMDKIEEARYSSQVVRHFKEQHNDYKCHNQLPNDFEIYAKRIIRGVFKDLLGLILLPFSFVVSVLHEVFEWLNDRIGLFD